MNCHHFRGHKNNLHALQSCATGDLVRRKPDGDLALNLVVPSLLQPRGQRLNGFSDWAIFLPLVL